ncbi:MAG: winged helix-turn-helix domain-containing protein, partial [Myxococcota bacterium]
MLGSAEVDLEARLVRAPSGEQALSDLEARLLIYFAGHAGTAVSRRKLLAEVWGYAPQVESRAVDHTIARLRRKIEPDPTHPRWLRSVRGVGYRLEWDPTLPELPRDDFVGRTDELARVRAARSSGARLITLQGPAGIGKTRLAQQLATAGPVTATAWLRDARDAAGVLRAVARALDVDPERPDLVDVERARLGRVLNHLGPLTLVLDNAEHLHAEVIAAVEAWLPSAPALQVLVTSRRPLGLEDEVVVALPPLGHDDAVALMIARARRVRPRYHPLGTERETLAALATGPLEGLPLAIELAAARFGVLDLEGVAKHLQRRFQLLTAPGRDTGDARWRSLEAALRWSWELLSPVEQSALAQCTVFVGGFDMAAAEAVIETEGAFVVDVVGSLVDHALIVHRGGEPPRFDMLDSVREFVAGEAVPGGAVQRHIRWCAEAVAPTYEASGPNRIQARRAVIRERDNLQAAHRRALDARDVEAALALAKCLYRLTAQRGPDREGVPILEDTRALVPRDHPQWFELQWRLVDALRQSNQYERSLALVESSLEEAVTDQDRAQIHVSAQALYIELGDHDRFV